jgi:hypothetical protein
MHGWQSGRRKRRGRRLSSSSLNNRCPFPVWVHPKVKA